MLGDFYAECHNYVHFAVIMLRVVVLSVIMQSVVIQSVVMQSVLAPYFTGFKSSFRGRCKSLKKIRLNNLVLFFF